MRAFIFSSGRFFFFFFFVRRFFFAPEERRNFYLVSIKPTDDHCSPTMALKFWIIGFVVMSAVLISSASNPFLHNEEHPESWEDWLHSCKDSILDTFGFEYDEYPFMKFTGDLPFDQEDFNRLLKASLHKPGGEWDNAAALGLPKDWKVDPKCQSKGKEARNF